MKDSIMKKYLVSIGLIVVLLVAWTAFGQRDNSAERTGGARRQNLSPEETEKMRERFQNMSEEERQVFRERMRKRFENMSELSEDIEKFRAQDREKLRAQMSSRFGSGRTRISREDQLKAIEAISEQLAKLKKSLKGMKAPSGSYRDMSEEESTKFRESVTKTLEVRQAALQAIEQELAKIGGMRQQMAAQQQSLRELNAIREQAVKDKAEGTVKLLDRLIEKRRQGRGERPDQGRETRPRPEGTRRQRPEASSLIEQKREKAPDFALSNFNPGKKAERLYNYEGKIVVLEWLNFGCPFSKYHYETKTTMVDLAKKYKAKNVAWLAINSTHNTTADENKAFAQKNKVPFPILDDRRGKVGHAFGAKTTPHIFIMDAKGRIAYNGAIDNSPMGKTPAGQTYINYVDKALSELTGGKAVSTPTSKPYGCTVKYPK